MKVVRVGLKCCWLLALSLSSGLLNAPAFSQQGSDSSDKPAVAPAPAKPSQGESGTTTPPTSKSAHPKSPPPAAKSGKKPSSAVTRSAAAKRRKRPMSPRVRRIRQAFVASTTLRPMAQQLIQDRTPAGYSGVEAYARAHSKEDAGALAWLVVGYAHLLDHDGARGIDLFNRASPFGGDLGTCYLQTGHQAEGLAALANFDTTYPDSLLIRDAHLSYATALLSEGRAAEAVALLEKDRLPARSDIEFALGRTSAVLGQTEKAGEALANVYYNMPTAAEADAAYTELKRLPSAPPPTPAQLKTRADLLMKAKRYNDAVDEKRELASHATPELRPSAELAFADAMHRSGRNREAQTEVADLPGHTADQNAQRLYILGEIAWASNDNDEFYRTVNELRQAAPTSTWLEQALLSVANLHLVHHEYDQALDAFRELQQRFPTGSRASYAHWKAAWLTLRFGRNQEAKKQFDEQIGLYPSGNETSAALYWRARLAEEDNQPGMAPLAFQT